MCFSEPTPWLTYPLCYCVWDLSNPSPIIQQRDCPLCRWLRVIKVVVIGTVLDNSGDGTAMGEPHNLAPRDGAQELIQAGR